MTAATPLIVGKQSQEAIVHFHRSCHLMLNSQYNLRQQMREVDLSYIREMDWTTENQRAKLANRYGDATKFQNVTVPVVMPQVESAVTYQTSVFLTGSPLFGWVAAPEQESAAIQYQTIVEENSIRGGWVQQLMKAFRDGFKYNMACCEVGWGRETVNTIETSTAFGTEGKPKEVIWSGNTLKHWDMYNTFWDSRYTPTEMYKKGEFIGTTEFMSRVQLKAFLANLPDKMISNVKEAFESGNANAGGSMTYYRPQINPNSFINQVTPGNFNWESWAGMLPRPEGEIAYKNGYEVSTLYARIIPQDFRLKVPGANTPQIWKFITINHKVLVYAERQTNAHNYLPVLFMQPNEDGLGYQSKSLAQNAKPFQEIASALINSAMAARRRAISDRGIYNPLLVSASHINSESPIAKIPMRPAGYNKTPQEAYYPIPYRDDQSAIAFQELPQILQMANNLNGRNQAQQGQFVKGNKTVHEFSTVMANANGRDQTVSLLLEAQFFTPLKEIIKINTLQYQPPGVIFSPSRQEQIKIDPVELRKATVTFKLTDGLIPADKVISGDEFAVAMQTIGSSPQLSGEYNLGPMFSYLMKTRNADLTPFEKSAEQKAYEQALQAWQQTVLQLAKQMGDAVDPSKFPPQPTPEAYGYKPGTLNSPQAQKPQPQGQQ